MLHSALRLVAVIPALLVVANTNAADSPGGGTEIGPFSATDWPWWRGPARDGVASADQNPPLAWSENENIVWRRPIPGMGHGSPIIVGDSIYLATSVVDAETRSVLCLNRSTGEERWSTVVHEGHSTPPKNKKGTQASSTPACDGQRLFINFLHDDAMYTTALSLEGDQLWQMKISDYVVHQGFGASPAIHGPLVIVSADNKSGGAVSGLDRETGDVVWRHDRPDTPNYSSPVVLDVAGRTQLIMTGCDLVSGFDPLSGEKLWEFEGATTECVTSTVTDGEHIYTSGGYPTNHVAAVRADGSGEVTWRNGTRVYVPSMLARDGYLYATPDAGTAVCWKSDTGEEMWQGRLGGTFSSSPVLVGDRIYVTDETCHTYIFRASPDGFELLGENQLGDECFATPVICDSRIYTRVAHQEDGERREYLYCIGD